MELVSLKCPNCHAQLEVDDSFARADCPFCGSGFLISSAIEAKHAEEAGYNFEKGRQRAQAEKTHAAGSAPSRSAAAKPDAARSADAARPATTTRPAAVARPAAATRPATAKSSSPINAGAPWPSSTPSGVAEPPEKTQDKLWESPFGDQGLPTLHIDGGALVARCLLVVFVAFALYLAATLITTCSAPAAPEPTAPEPAPAPAPAPVHVHTWEPATCTEPRTCSDCGQTQGEPLGHSCQVGRCSRCEQEFFAPSPIRIEVRASMDGRGNVEWQFRFTVTGDESISQIILEWEALDAEGNRLTCLDGGHQRCVKGWNVTGSPLQPGQTTDWVIPTGSSFRNPAFAQTRLAGVQLEVGGRTLVLTDYHTDVADVPCSLEAAPSWPE